MKTAQLHSPTKERLFDAAQALILAKGFAATTVDEICGAAKLTKGSFFHYFESKDELGKTVLERFCAKGKQMLEAVYGNERDPLKRVYRQIETFAKMSQDPNLNKGCLLGCFAQELSDTHPQIRTICCQEFGAWAERFGQELARAKAQYSPKASFDPHELAEYFIAIVEGSMILGKAKRDMKVVAQNLRHFKAYVQSLFKR